MALPTFMKKIDFSKTSRRMSGATWLWDMMNLRKVLQLCSRCQYALPHHWEKKYHYAKWKHFTGINPCDYCKNEAVVDLFRSTDDPWYAECERNSRAVSATRARDAAFAVTDRRSWAMKELTNGT